jgi:hypothetical protein
MALVDILEDVLESLDGGNGLYIDMAVILPDEVGTESDDPAIVNLLSLNVMCVASVPTPGRGIGILRN